MSMLYVHSIDPGCSFQDMGRPGYLAAGLTRGGAIDPMALTEGAALLQQDPNLAVIEMAGMGGRFEARGPLRIALSGVDMGARINDMPVAWHACHQMQAGDSLVIQAARRGGYGYLHAGGGFDTPVLLAARGAHLSAGLGRSLTQGDTLMINPDSGGRTGYHLVPPDRFSGGMVRILPSIQTDQFDAQTRARFEATEFTRDGRANRQGMRMDHAGAGFSNSAQRKIVSEIIVPGDIQITGDGTPFVLMCESQTTGGYPRIGTVIPCDLPRVAQCPLGKCLTFRFITMQEAIAAQRYDAGLRAKLPRLARPIVRRPADIPDLLSYNLISGAVNPDEKDK